MCVYFNIYIHVCVCVCVYVCARARACICVCKTLVSMHKNFPCAQTEINYRVVKAIDESNQ